VNLWTATDLHTVFNFFIILTIATLIANTQAVINIQFQEQNAFIHILCPSSAHKSYLTRHKEV
jgi:hypothetical protein